MTSTKIFYLAATIMPFGFVLLASAFLIHRLVKLSAARKARLS